MYANYYILSLFLLFDITVILAWFKRYKLSFALFVVLLVLFTLVFHHHMAAEKIFISL